MEISLFLAYTYYFTTATIHRVYTTTSTTAGRQAGGNPLPCLVNIHLPPNVFFILCFCLHCLPPPSPRNVGNMAGSSKRGLCDGHWGEKAERGNNRLCIICRNNKRFSRDDFVSSTSSSGTCSFMWKSSSVLNEQHSVLHVQRVWCRLFHVSYLFIYLLTCTLNSQSMCPRSQSANTY